MPPACKRAKANTQSKTRAKKCSPTVIQVKYKKRIDKENRQLIQKKVIIDFEKPLALVSKYRSLGGLGIKNKKRDEEQKMLVVSSCRGEKTRTSDPPDTMCRDTLSNKTIINP